MKEFNVLSALKRIIFIIFLSSLSFLSFSQYQLEYLNRGVVAVSMGGTKVFVSWRWLGTEDNITFNLYRNGTKVNSTPLTVTNYTDNAGSTTASYTVKAIVNGVEQAASEAATPWAQKYYSLPLNVPAGGTTPSGEAYTYSPNDCSVGDVDGDGALEIFVKWDPSNSKDNSQKGYTGNVYIDCYTMKGTFLWRIDLGKNIRAGAHYTQFLVYDFDGDGKAEMACKTADGTKDGKGVVIGSATADYRNSSGYILSGPEFLTVFNGKTGAAMDTKNYTPGRGTVSSWGDSYGNRVDRFIATVAYLDGQRPSMVFGRGYYTRLVRSAWDFKNGQLVQRWIFDSNTSGNGSYAGMGNHQMTVGDVDGDGKQEVCNGASAIDNDGKGLYANGLGHGDALHMTDMDPDRPGQEVWQCQEEPKRYGNYGLNFKDAKTGQPIWGLGGGDQGDIGRCMAGDIDPRYKGYEVWGAGKTYTCKGVVIANSRPSECFGVYWDGDLQRELLDGSKLDEWDYVNSRLNRLATLYDASYGGGTSCNTTKATPNISGDLFGDWREEIILHSADNKNLLIYTTTIPTNYKFRTLLSDPQYRVAISWQNAAYNQPPHLSYYLGEDMATPAKPNITIIPGTASCSSSITAPSTSFCSGGSVILTANTGASYKWFNGTTQVGTAATYTATTAGSYTLEVTNATGCKATSSPVAITVSAYPTAIITAPSGTSIPYGGTTTLNASTGTGYTYQWKKENTTITGATASSYTTNLPGSYTVTISTACSTTSSAVVLVAATAKKYIYNYDNSGNLSWSNTNSWTPKAIPTTIDTVIIRTGEAQINALTHTAPVYVETNGTLRLVTANSTIDKLYMQGGTLKVFTSTPELVLTSNITVQQASTIIAGSVAATIFTLNGTITGNANLTKTSVGVLRINSTATGYKGNWIITEGKIQLRSTSGLGVCGVQVKTGARLDIEVAGASIYSLVIENGGGVDLDQNLNANVAVFGTNNILTGAYKNANYPTYIGSTGTLNVSNSLVTLSGPTTFCSGNSLILTSSSGMSYLWKNNTTQAGTNVTYTATVSGSFTVDATSSAGCKVTSAPVATILSTTPTATITATATSFCTGESVTLTASAGTSYKWFNGTTQVSTASTYTATAAGAYTVEVTNSAGCKATSAVTQISVSAAPTATITTSATSFCAGGSAILKASTGSSYKWFNGTTQVGTASTYTATAAGAYTVEVTNSAGCKATSAVTPISVSAAPTVTITTSAISFCAGGSAILTASTGTSYKWFNGATQVGTSSTYTATIAGAYTVEVTNASGCKATSAATQINESTPSAPVITSASTAICPGSSVTLNTSIGISYKWFNGTTQVGTSATYIATAAGSYTVEVINASGCRSTSTAAQITESSAPAIPVIASPVTSFCAGGSVILSSSSATSYKWFNGTAQVGTSSAYTATAPGAYTVEVTNAAGCKATSAVTQITIASTVTWYADIDNDGLGDVANTINSCAKPNGYVAIAGDACPTDANKTVAGNCGCGNTENSCLDCAGTPNGTAFYDNCSICVGGTTSNTACISTATVNGTSANIKVVPQPFDNNTTISIENLGMIQAFTIISASGALVEVKQGINTDNITLGESLASGLYTVIINTDNGIYTTKIVKK